MPDSTPAPSPHPTIRLNDGREMPALGLGTWQMSNSEAGASVPEAVAAGYRLIDTAAIYENESGVGQGIRAAGLPRDQLFVTTKVWNDSHGRAGAARALGDSLRRLGTDYIDLYLIHWPVPRLARFVETWEALVELRSRGLVRSIGVSNFNREHLDAIIATGVTPALNQIEFHPELQQPELCAFHTKQRIVTQAWSPLGRGRSLGNPAIVAIAARHRRSPAQIILRWEIQRGFSTIPKSSTPARIRENAALFDFELSREDIGVIDGLDAAHRIGPDPATFG